jgi:hypothetical protein
VKRHLVLVASLALCLASTVLLLLLRWIDFHGERQQPAGMSTVASSSGGGGAVAPPQFLPPRVAADPPGTIERRFAAATNYKAVIDGRADNPAQASFFYAARAQSRCAAFVSLSAGSPSFALPRTDQSAAARQRLDALCAGVKVGPDLTAMTIADEGVAAGDAFFSAVGMFQDLMSPLKSQPASMTAVIEMTGSRETPILASAALEVLSLPHVLKTLDVFGEPASSLPPDKLAAMSTAMLVARCDLGADCGPTSFAVEFECAVNGNCAKSLEESLRSDYERQQRGNRPDWRAVQAYRERIVAAVGQRAQWIAPR